ncbi:hypothetical protein [Butyrivibrio sp. LB2008]|uniref:hypothetical protein n=1 Tax=Butyrivibrio sp. LB2008 TaxID=1408305 RepID=UPI00047E091A|nr:hypothetical protein [Butyrivibrio sp. LB2008]
MHKFNHCFSKPRHSIGITYKSITNRETIKVHKIIGKTIELDEEALKVLDGKYPLPKPVEVIEDIETIKELAATRKELADTRKILIEKEEKISELQEQLLVASRQIVQAEAMQLLVEDKKEQIQKEMEKSAKLQEELNQEKAKTWIQKFFGK